MTTKTWARLSGSTVAELQTFDAALEPGKDVPALWTDDVTNVPGIAAGWVKAGDGTFAAPFFDPFPLKTAVAEALSRACAAAIAGGYASSALGAPHWYASKETDQANLDADMMAAAAGGAAANPPVTADIACSADNGGTWTVVTHNAAQVVQLWGDFRAWRVAQQAKNRTLQTQIAAATTVDAVAAIVWA